MNNFFISFLSFYEGSPCKSRESFFVYKSRSRRKALTITKKDGALFLLPGGAGLMYDTRRCGKLKFSTLHKITPHMSKLSHKGLIFVENLRFVENYVERLMKS